MRMFKISAALVITMFAIGCQANSDKSLPLKFAAQPHSIEDWQGVPRLSENGAVLFAGQPTQDGLRTLAKSGVKIVINLRSVNEMQSVVDLDEAEFVNSLGMEYVHIPMTPSAFSSQDVTRLKEVLDKASTNENQNPAILIHCKSSNRVGGMWAVYLNSELGFDTDKAIEYGKNAGLRSDSMISATKRVMN